MKAGLMECDCNKIEQSVIENLAPIVLFTYNRVQHTMKTVEALKKNLYAQESHLYIFSDAPENKEQIEKVEKVRSYLKNIDGFKKITIIERKENMGLANNIIDGITEIVNRYGKIIVVEDDIVTSKFFLKYMNDALEIYRNIERVMAVSGYFWAKDKNALPETFLFSMFACWGWGTWKRSWDLFDRNPQKLIEEFSEQTIYRFNVENSMNQWQQVIDNFTGKISTWAIFFIATIFKNNGLVLYPKFDLSSNIGMDGTGVHCGRNTKYEFALCEKEISSFTNDIKENILAKRKIKDFFQGILDWETERDGGGLDILFVIPPLLRVHKQGSAYGLPLGLAYMAAYLKQHGMRSLIYNADSCPTRLTKRAEIAERWQMDETKPDTVDEAIAMEFVAVLDKLRPKVVGFTSKVVDIKITLQLAEIAKAAYPKIKVLIGGVSASTCTAYLLRNHQVDYLVMGEGEQTIVELTAALLGRPDAPAPETVAGIAYRDRTTGCIRRTATRPLIENLDELPFPEREAMFVVKDGALVRAVEAGDIIVSRGCPYRCKFCAAYVNWGTHRPRFRSNENVVAELMYLVERYGQRRFIFWDDLFTSNRARIMDLCERIIAAKLKIRWICLARINTIDVELLEKMKAAGCMEVQLGIESGNDRILQHINKGITLQMIYDKLPALRQCGIFWRAFFIVGFPGETLAEMEDTLALIEKVQPSIAQLGIFCPYPGTEFGDLLQAQGVIGENDLGFDVTNPYYNYTGTMEDRDFTAWCIAALAKVDAYNERTVGRFLNERIFKGLETVLSGQQEKKIVVFQCARPALTKRIVEALLALGAEVHVILHERFVGDFAAFIERVKLHVFQGNEKFLYAERSEWIARLAGQENFAATVLPCNTLLGEGYGELERLAADAAGRMLARINVLGEFLPYPLESASK